MLPRTLLTRAKPAGVAERLRVLGFGKAEVLHHLPSGCSRAPWQLQRTDKSPFVGEVLPLLACAWAFALVTHKSTTALVRFGAPFSKVVSSGLALCLAGCFGGWLGWARTVSG